MNLNALEFEIKKHLDFSENYIFQEDIFYGTNLEKYIVVITTVKSFFLCH